MVIIENLTEELGEKELRIMELERQLKHEKEEKIKYYDNLVVKSTTLNLMYELDIIDTTADIDREDLIENLTEQFIGRDNCIDMMDSVCKELSVGVNFLKGREEIEEEWESVFQDPEFEEEEDEDQTWGFCKGCDMSKKLVKFRGEEPHLLVDLCEDCGIPEERVYLSGQRFRKIKPNNVREMIQNLVVHSRTDCDMNQYQYIDGYDDVIIFFRL